MITSDSFRHELVTLSKESTYPAIRLYLYFMGTYTHEWQEYDLEAISQEMEISRATLYRGLRELIKKGHVQKTETAEKLTRVKIQNLSLRSETSDLKSETEISPIRNIKGERVYLFFVLNIIFLVLDKINISSLSDIPYMQTTSLRFETEDLKFEKIAGQKYSLKEQIYSLTEEFYEQLRDIGIRVNDKLKAQLDYVGAEEVTEIYDRIMWDEAIRKPSTIFLKEVGKAAKEKRKAEADNRIHASNYLTWAGSREFSLRQIYDQCKSFKNWSKEGIIGEWRKRSSYFGYTEHEIGLFKREVIEKELGEEKSRLED